MSRLGLKELFVTNVSVTEMRRKHVPSRVLHGTSYAILHPPVPASNSPVPVPLPPVWVPLPSRSRTFMSRSRPGPADTGQS